MPNNNKSIQIGNWEWNQEKEVIEEEGIIDVIAEDIITEDSSEVSIPDTNSTSGLEILRGCAFLIILGVVVYLIGSILLSGIIPKSCPYAGIVYRDGIPTELYDCSQINK